MTPRSRPAPADPGLELQIDLDTTSGPAGGRVRPGGRGRRPGCRDRDARRADGGTRLLPLARLTEVALHHVDLDVGYGVDDIDEKTAAWLLEWSAFRLRQRDEFPRLELTSTSGHGITVGSSGKARQVRGSNARLLGWLTSRCAPSAVEGAGTLRLPPF